MRQEEAPERRWVRPTDAEKEAIEELAKIGREWVDQEVQRLQEKRQEIYESRRSKA